MDKYRSDAPRHKPFLADDKLIIYKVNFTTYPEYENREYELEHQFKFIEANGKILFDGVQSSYSSSKDITPNLVCEQSVEMHKIYGSWKSTGTSDTVTSFEKLSFYKNGKYYWDNIRNKKIKKRYTTKFILNKKDSSIRYKGEIMRGRMKILRLTDQCLEFRVDGQRGKWRFDRMK